MSDKQHFTEQSAESLRDAMAAHYLADESVVVNQLIQRCKLSATQKAGITEKAIQLVNAVRKNSDPQIMESFLGEYGLSSEEGIALMCLAEALLRVPDAPTVDALIQDKIVPADWGRHLGKSSSSLVNASTWALMLTGKIIADEPEGIVGALRGAVRRLGEPVVRTAVSQAIRELGNQFVLGENIDDAMKKSLPAVNQGYTYSYDMLGEAARTDADAKRYHLSYSDAIATLSSACTGDSVSTNPGISVKLSALYPRYEFAQKAKVMVELVARTRSLAMLTKSANMGFNIDAEEADRLDLSLDVIEAVLSEPSLAGWNGFGIVVQAYSLRAWYAVDCLYDMSVRLDRHIMIRLVKGAYWDTEVKRAQVLGLNGFPVFTRKSNTDISYIACAEKLLGMTDRIYPQFATHNAHTVAAVLEMATDKSAFEFQRLHGMGDALHNEVHSTEKTRCRIYAPVGAHEDLLAYLVRRLLENGANSSFVNQIVDEDVSASDIAADPFSVLDFTKESAAHPAITPSSDLYGSSRVNSSGLDLTDATVIATLNHNRQGFETRRWTAKPMLPHSESIADGTPVNITNPAQRDDIVGQVTHATEAHVDLAIKNAIAAQSAWHNTSTQERQQLLLRTADLFEANTPELMSMATREAGKTLADGIAEIREAVDFLRYYPTRAIKLTSNSDIKPRGTFVCISPWNFPLAIFTGQIAAALATGNTVIAKPAEQTPLIAARAIELFLEAGVPASVLQLLPGVGSSIGAQLVADPRINGVCFTGSTITAKHIHTAISHSGQSDTPLIAETGGINAMIVDSTALPEQAIRDILASAFQSAGQRCSALRVLYVQSDIYDRVITMLAGAMDLLTIGNPWNLSTDVGPVIDEQAANTIREHCDRMTQDNRLIHQINLPSQHEIGTFIAPAVFRLDNIKELKAEIFGPVLHVISFSADELPDIISQINNTGYGLTFGLHTRVDERVQDIVDGIEAGNLYINRNQIGAVVGSQPFGGKGLSGTGPKAGGPHYALRFLQCPDIEKVTVTGNMSSHDTPFNELEQSIRQLRSIPVQQLLSPARVSEITDLLRGRLPENISVSVINQAMQFVDFSYHETMDLPGPTGESNRLGMQGAGLVLCLQNQTDPAFWIAQILQSLATGNRVLAMGTDTRLLQTVIDNMEPLPLIVTNGHLATDALSQIDIDVIATSKVNPDLHQIRCALASRSGPILSVCTDLFDISPLIDEKSLCIDTTAAGGNASLLALAE